jgi:NRPS condensation-like uncharacterized protein
MFQLVVKDTNTLTNYMKTYGFTINSIFCWLALLHKIETQAQWNSFWLATDEKKWITEDKKVLFGAS